MAGSTASLRNLPAKVAASASFVMPGKELTKYRLDGEEKGAGNHSRILPDLSQIERQCSVFLLRNCRVAYENRNGTGDFG
jgi:hypothetical protein